MNIERQLEINEKRHFAADARYEAKMDKAEQLIKPTGDPKIFYVEYSTKTGRTRTVVGDWGTCFEKAMKLV